MASIEEQLQQASTQLATLSESIQAKDTLITQLTEQLATANSQIEISKVEFANFSTKATGEALEQLAVIEKANAEIAKLQSEAKTANEKAIAIAAQIGVKPIAKGTATQDASNSKNLTDRCLAAKGISK